MPDELWMEVHDIVQETGIKTIHEKKQYKKAKWLSDEDLQIAEERRDNFYFHLYCNLSMTHPKILPMTFVFL